MPHQGHFAKLYYKNLNVLEYDDKYLQTAKKNGLIKNHTDTNQSIIDYRKVYGIG